MIPLPFRLRRRASAEDLKFSRMLLLGIIQYFLESGEEPERVAEVVKEIGRLIADQVYLDFRTTFRRSVKTFFDLLDAIYSSVRKYSGREPERMTVLLDSASRKLVIRIQFKNPFCEGIVMPLGPIKPGELFSGMLEWIEEQRLEMFGASKVSVHEEKCQALGDDVDEYVITFFLTPEGFKRASREFVPDRTLVIK